MADIGIGVYSYLNPTLFSPRKVRLKLVYPTDNSVKQSQLHLLEEHFDPAIRW